MARTLSASQKDDLRNHFAGQALVAFYSNDFSAHPQADSTKDAQYAGFGSVGSLAQACYEIADALLRAREAGS